MAESQKSLFLDEEIGPQILALFRQAQKQIVIVTPYLKLWRHAGEAIALALSRGVKVSIILRSENGVLQSDIANLLDFPIEVLAVEYLHAKIYMNERDVMISSMNLTDFSEDNSKEIALLIRDEQVEQDIRSYVKDRLMPLSQPVASATAEHEGNVGRQPAQRTSPTGVAGVCIRCGRSLYFEPNKPLCDPCYGEWAQWSNDEYPEHFCHACGTPSVVTYARPLCGPCYQRLR